MNQGVRQGCVLSPLLFNIFLSDLPKKLELIQGKLKLDSTEIGSLIWADDIILLAENENYLAQMLSTVETFCKDNKLTVNTDKTKCMIFNKTGRLFRNKFYLNGVELENVRSYKYLGFLFTPSGEIKSGLHDLRDRAFKAFMKLRNQMGTSFNQNIPIALDLFDTMIKPILLYSSDFWGCLKLPKENPIDKLHMMFCKQLLGVQKQTTNIGVLLELGRIPLNIYACKYAIKNWERIKGKNSNDLLLSSYNDAVNENLIWISNLKTILEGKGMLNLFINSYETKPAFINKKLFQTLSDEFHQNAFENIRKEQSKLRTYALFKTEIGFEKYLTEIKNPVLRTEITKFRLSNHRLMIETGRHKNIPKELRFCPFCPCAVETEMHFLLLCPVYNSLRTEMMLPISILKPSFTFYTKEEKFQFLLSNIDKFSTCKYISKAFELRTFLCSYPKMLI